MIRQLDSALVAEIDSHLNAVRNIISNVWCSRSAHYEFDTIESHIGDIEERMKDLRLMAKHHEAAQNASNKLTNQ